MTRWWEDPVNQPKEPPTIPTPEDREALLKQTLEQLEKECLSANRGTGAWRAGLRAKKALDEAYGEDRGA
ncbi:hypothetical protein [Paenibacillus humicus]|uniref:hypothetical protein n=1 Tax=Paenibacillus humicus TaxID=412861 RepID=UPI003D2ABB7C